MAKARKYYSIPFNFASVAVGQRGSVQQKQTSEGPFIVTGISGSIRDANGVVRLDKNLDTPKCFLEFNLNDGPWQLAPVAFETLIQPDEINFVATQPVIPAGATINCFVTNSHTAGITPYVTLTGYVEVG